MRRFAGCLAVALAAIAVAPEPAAAKDESEADCARFAMALPYSPVFVANGLLCHTFGDHLGQVEKIEARGRHNFTLLRHLVADDTSGILPDDLEYFADRTGLFRTTEQWGALVRRGEFATQAFGGVSRDRAVKGYECAAFSRYSGAGAAPGSFRHELIGLFCFESSKGPVPMDRALIEDFLKRLRLEF